jgi:hypothetical protein
VGGKGARLLGKLEFKHVTRPEEVPKLGKVPRVLRKGSVEAKRVGVTAYLLYMNCQSYRSGMLLLLSHVLFFLSPENAIMGLGAITISRQAYRGISQPITRGGDHWQVKIQSILEMNAQQQIFDDSSPTLRFIL